MLVLVWSDIRIVSNRVEPGQAWLGGSRTTDRFTDRLELEGIEKMAHAKRRESGKWTAVYRTSGGKERSAGTFDTEELAREVADQKEHWLRSGSNGLDPETRATMTIAQFAPRWLREHPVEPSTTLTYHYALKNHILPMWGNVRLADLRTEEVRSYFQELHESGIRGQHVKAALSALMRRAIEDGYRDGPNPARFKRRKGELKPKYVMRVEDFEKVYDCLPTDGARLLADLIVSTGCRLMEAVPLLVSDIDFDRQEVRFIKAVQDVGRDYHPDKQSRFFIATYTKTGDHRDRVDIDDYMIEKLRDWIKANDLIGDDALFPPHLVVPSRRARRSPQVELTPELIATLGTITAENGREYQHGTYQGYVTAKCRDCVYCRQAAADYRYELEQRKALALTERAANDDDVTRAALHTVVSKLGYNPNRFYNTTPMLDRGRWGKVWRQACADAGLSFVPTARQLRHTHASWLAKAGVDIKTVSSRLGHKDLSTTHVYVELVGDGDRSASEAMARIRQQRRAG